MPRPPNLRLWAYVLVGAVLGCCYVAFDLVSEHKIEHGTLTGVIAPAHHVVDHSFPVLAGGLLGLCIFQLRLRDRLRAAEQAAERAEALRLRLQRVERDQAVWVLAAAVLHELNNPLHALGLLLDEQCDPDTDSDSRLALAHRARGQVSRALGHLATLRSMHNVGEPDLQRVELDRIALALASDMGALEGAEGVAVRVACQGPVNALADPTYVRTILENLLDNSVHALRSCKGGAVTIELATSAAHAVVSVEDDGPPLTPEARLSLFDPLRSTKKEGLGLGLPIARALARAMRGDLTLEPGKTKTFRLELPLA